LTRVFNYDNLLVGGKVGNKEKILKVIKQHKGELVLDLFKVVRLKGFYETEEDYYYVYEQIPGETFYSSCVGSFIPLKGKIDKEHYDELVRVFGLNFFGGGK